VCFQISPLKNLMVGYFEGDGSPSRPDVSATRPYH
jgi:hypothetical protein